MNPEPDFRWHVDELLYFRGMLYVRGWAFHPRQSVASVRCAWPGSDCVSLPAEDYGADSPDVAAVFGSETGLAAACRFTYRIEVPTSPQAVDIQLIFELSGGTSVSIKDLSHPALLQQPYHQLSNRFFQMLAQVDKPGRVLEIGSRSRSGNVSRDRLPAGWEYTGMDIKAGENVDVVGDAHALTATLPAASFDAVFSISTFEHLLMPWKAVLEINHVLKPGGLCLVCTHQSFPLHEVPWDFFRFSDQAWHGLFNHSTGFEILATGLGEPVSLTPHLLQRIFCGMENSAAFIGSAVLARKIGETRLIWDVNTADLLESVYPC